MQLARFLCIVIRPHRSERKEEKMTRERRSRRTEKEWPIIITYHWKRTRRVRRGGGKGGGGGMTAHVQGSELHRTRLGAAGVVRPQIVNNDTFLIRNRRSLGPKLICLNNLKYFCVLKNISKLKKSILVLVTIVSSSHKLK